MQYIKFKRPYLVMGHLESFIDENQLSTNESQRLSKNASNYIRIECESPDWIQDKQFKFIRTLTKSHHSHILSDTPPKAYIVEHNGIDFVIGSRRNSEEPEFISLVPEELFEM